MHMNDIRLPPRPPQQFQAGAAEVQVRLRFVVASLVDAVAAEIVALVPVRPHQQQLAPFADPAEAPRAQTLVLASPRHAELPVFLQVVDSGLVQALVEGEDDLDVVATARATPREPCNHISEAADLCERCHFGREVHNVQLERVLVLLVLLDLRPSPGRLLHLPKLRTCAWQWDGGEVHGGGDGLRLGLSYDIFSQDVCEASFPQESFEVGDPFP
mmetsp:Transcript_4623/g.12102  ORF Transcript_4623/g.12102 Transcript_4623/m.12102 type:complete len:215 (-) Transcript_4623:222-866(-)